MKYRHPYSGLLRINNIAGLVFIFPIPAIWCSSRPHGQPKFNPCLPAPIGVLDNLVPFRLGAPRQDGSDKLARQGIVDVFADTDDFRTSALDLLENHLRVV